MFRVMYMKVRCFLKTLYKFPYDYCKTGVRRGNGCVDECLTMSYGYVDGVINCKQ